MKINNTNNNCRKIKEDQEKYMIRKKNSAILKILLHSEHNPHCFKNYFRALNNYIK